MEMLQNGWWWIGKFWPRATVMGTAWLKRWIPWAVTVYICSQMSSFLHFHMVHIVIAIRLFWCGCWSRRRLKISSLNPLANWDCASTKFHKSALFQNCDKNVPFILQTVRTVATMVWTIYTFSNQPLPSGKTPTKCSPEETFYLGRNIKIPYFPPISIGFEVITIKNRIHNTLISWAYSVLTIGVNFQIRLSRAWGFSSGVALAALISS